MENFEELKKQLLDLAAVLNEFKSEAVQIRILDFVLTTESSVSGRLKNEVESRHRTARKEPPSNEGSNKSLANIHRATEKRKRGAVGTGAPATLAQLLSDNFFDQPRTINDVIEHCKHNLARTFKANEFSGKLGRMVRKGELSRKKNDGKQYEYKKP